MNTRIRSLHVFLLGVMVLLAGCAQSILRVPSAAAHDVASDEQILQATVIIRIKAQALDGEGQAITVPRNGREVPVYLTSGGLGTVVDGGRNRFIITHDHYAQLDAPVAEVSITDNSGTRIVMDIRAFHRLIHYRNNSVIILDAPADLLGGAPFADGETVQPDSIVQVVHRQKNTDTLVVVPAIVERLTEYQGIPCFRVRNLNGELIEKGNSGGGVWYQGRLVGIIHRTITNTCASPATVEAPGQPTHCSLATRLSPERMAILEQRESVAVR